MLIPCYDQFYGSVMELLPFESDASIRVLDLGAGTGLLAAWVRRQFPKAALCLLDFSEAMLNQARERLGNELVEYVLGDYTTDSLNGHFDAIVSALSIHHLEHPEKQKLFPRIYDALRPGGVFINAEQVAGPTPELSARYHQVSLAEARRLGATEQMIAEAEIRMREDRCASVEEQLGWMREAGFADADCWFKKGRFAVMSGSRQR
jgi:tRNA (cmo5U34)-methyltransferase